ncbi:MAG: enoyl-CoA hydratase/isomerase family protein [Bacteroidales bacterium]|nr:enoyl-CoA hydratase/isomerase family protein [Bacteroidales bacterium]
MVKLEADKEVVVLQLSNPPGNALLKPDFIEIEILNDFLKVNKAKAIIITGTSRHFCIGADINLLLNLVQEDTLKEHIEDGHKLLNYLYELNIPVFAAIEGFCFGGGLEIALSAHFRIASEKSLLAFPETIHRLMPGLSGTHALKKYFSLGQSIEFILSGRTMNAEEALNKGMVDYVVPAKSCLDFALKLAHKMTDDKPEKVINNVMIALKNTYTLSRDKALEEETRLFCELAADLNNEKIKKV